MLRDHVVHKIQQNIQHTHTHMIQRTIQINGKTPQSIPTVTTTSIRSMMMMIGWIQNGRFPKIDHFGIAVGGWWWQ